MSKVAYFHMYPGFEPRDIIDRIKRGVKSIIIEGYHSGTANTREDFGGRYNIIPALESARKKNIPVFLIFGYSALDESNEVGYTNFEEGHIYETSGKMLNTGIVPLKANWKNFIDVIHSLENIIDQTDDYDRIVEHMMSRYPFKNKKAIRKLMKN